MDLDRRFSSSFQLLYTLSTDLEDMLSELYDERNLKSAARGRPIMVEWERRKHSAGLSLVRGINQVSAKKRDIGGRATIHGARHCSYLPTSVLTADALDGQHYARSDYLN
ncbi:hypothetical protein EVAR_81573_1 [Eumeta japonica]|uniref:Uncharacterized protein n=1 Tax=Eumeta variegata TaxID=151549 RepID=A0A4C1V0N4_EUMVA|nr:hypothetical protein EVAR_81573_1 [Eumeta japonica]